VYETSSAGIQLHWIGILVQISPMHQSQSVLELQYRPCALLSILSMHGVTEA
jgi:hypothetical protein